MNTERGEALLERVTPLSFCELLIVENNPFIGI